MICSLAARALLLAVLGPVGERPIAEPAAPYEIVLQAASAALPEAPRRFVHSRLRDIEESLYAGPAVPGTAPHRPAAHFVLLDVTAKGQDWIARIDAVADFPTSRKDARDLYRSKGIEAGGDLPWLIEEHYNKLVEALRKNDAEAASRQTGILVHLATDAALPFNTTILAKDELLGTSEDASADAGRRLRDRFHGTFLERLKERLAYEVRVAPLRVQTVRSPLDAAFAAAVAANRTAQELAEIDNDAIRRLGISDVASFAASADVYVAYVAERVAPLLENQLEAGALLSANLILTAWNGARPEFDDEPSASQPAGDPSQPAGSPPAPSPVVGQSEPQDSAVKRVPAPAEPRQSTRGEEQSKHAQALPESGLFGSLSSTVYHRGTCSHVARIKPENRVEFQSKAEAEASGRKPCKACKPDLEDSRHEK